MAVALFQPGRPASHRRTLEPSPREAGLDAKIRGVVQLHIRHAQPGTRRRTWR